MNKYVKVYMDAHGYDESDTYIPSEISFTNGVDIHHIVGRGKGGTNRIENLMALTRAEHLEMGDKKKYMVLLLQVHQDHLDYKMIPYDPDWFTEMLTKYDV